MRIVTLALASLLFVGCASTVRYALLGTREHSTTEGEAQLVERDDGRYDVNVSIDRLPALERLGEDLHAYVLWIQADGAGSATRADVVTLDATTRIGRAHAIVPSGRFTLRVTAETSADVEQPSDRVIIATVLEPTD